MKRKKYFIGFGVLLLALIIGSVTFVKANPSYFSQVASSTVVYMTPGAATTTVTFDTGITTGQAMDNASFLLAFAGSSTASSLNIQFEYSQDASTWYADKVNNIASSTSLTETRFPLTPANVFVLTMASTSLGGVTGNAATTTRIFSVATPTRYIRAILSMPAGSLNGDIEQRFFLGKRQNN